MYNPSRGGVRGGADQFTWESVKNDKHRENYLGHSLMAPVGRWQKGKDLSWYAKERKNIGTLVKPEISELAAIKQAEEEAMLIALGHNVVRKTQTLSKEDIREALKRNTGERDEHDIERVDGVGAASQRVALLSSGERKMCKQKSEGVLFESHRKQNSDLVHEKEKMHSNLEDGRKRSKKKSKKHKKEKKHKKHHKESRNSDSSENTSQLRTKHRKTESNSASKSSSKVQSHKKFNHKHKNYSSDDSEHEHHNNEKSKRTSQKKNDFAKRCRYDISNSD